MHSLVIFDCDGVLVDSEKLSHSVLREMIHEYGVVLSLEETIERFMGTSKEKCLAVLASLIGRSVPTDFLSTFQERSFSMFKESLTAVAGVREVIADLTTLYCVASNGPREKIRFTLNHTGLLPLFEQRIFSAQDVAQPKPAPDLFLHAAQSLRVSASQCVVVEDSPTGVTAALSAGMRVLGFAGMGQSEKLHRAGAHEVFHSMTDLPSLLGRAL